MRSALRQPIARYLAAGMILEAVAFCVVMSAPSDQPPTALQQLLGYTQIPGGALMSLLFGHGVGFQIDKLPRLLGGGIVYTGFGVTFLFQSALMALPFYLAACAWKQWGRHSRQLFPPLP